MYILHNIAACKYEEHNHAWRLLIPGCDAM